MSTTTCRSCGALVPAGAFCGGCGTPLPAPMPTAAEARLAMAGFAPGAEAGSPLVAGPAPAPPATAPQAFAHPASAPTMPFHPPFQGQPFSGAPVQPGLVPPQHGQVPPPYGQPFPPQPLSQPAPLSLRRGSGSRVPAALVAFTVAALAVGGYVAVGQTGNHTVTGSLSLTDSSTYGLSTGQSCSGGSGYDDIDGGTEVVVTNESGTTVATDTLQSGVYDGSACVFHFNVADVPKAKYYRVSAGRSTRGGPQYSYDEMDKQHWSVQLTLGD